MLRSELGRAVLVAAVGGFFLGGGAWSGSRPLDSRFLRLSRLFRLDLSAVLGWGVPVLVPGPGAEAGAGDGSTGVPGELTSDGGPEVAISHGCSVSGIHRSEQLKVVAWKQCGCCCPSEVEVEEVEVADKISTR